MICKAAACMAREFRFADRHDGSGLFADREDAITCRYATIVLLHWTQQPARSINPQETDGVS